MKQLFYFLFYVHKLRLLSGEIQLLIIKSLLSNLSTISRSMLISAAWLRIFTNALYSRTVKKMTILL